MNTELVTVPVHLPDFFTMNVQSVYGKLCQLAFYDHPELRPYVEPMLAQLAQQGCNPLALLEEEIIFKVGEQSIAVRQNLAMNNQLLAASRQVSEFAFGYEPEIHCAIDVLTQPDAVLVDIGSNWGPITLQAALRPGFHGQVHCFEPQHNAINMLQAFVDTLHLQQRVFPNKMALSDRNGYATLSQASWSGNRRILEEGIDGPRDCPLARLDDILTHIKPDLLKIDVEGYEAKVLAGALHILQTYRPLIIFEDHQHHSHAHFESLQQLGYHLYALVWFNPFESSINEKPNADWPVQLLAFKPFSLNTRHQLPNRINVLAAPEVLTN